MICVSTCTTSVAFGSSHFPLDDPEGYCHGIWCIARKQRHPSFVHSPPPIWIWITFLRTYRSTSDSSVSDEKVTTVLFLRRLVGHWFQLPPSARGKITQAQGSRHREANVFFQTKRSCKWACVHCYSQGLVQHRPGKASYGVRCNAIRGLESHPKSLAAWHHPRYISTSTFMRRNRCNTKPNQL